MDESENKRLFPVLSATQLQQRENKQTSSSGSTTVTTSATNSEHSDSHDSDRRRSKSEGRRNRLPNADAELDCSKDDNINTVFRDQPTVSCVNNGTSETLDHHYDHVIVNVDNRQKTTSFVLLLSTFSAIGGFLFGYDTGVVSGAMLLLKDEFHLSSFEQEVIVSVTIGGACFAALLGGYLSDKFGRKVCTLFASFVFTVGAVVLGVAQNVVMLIAGRLILGIGIGVASMTVPVYIAEVAPAYMRGRLVTINVLFITGGQFIASVMDGAFSYMKHDGWRYMFGLAGAPSLVQMIGFLFLPESPRYLMMMGKDERARHVLQSVRGVADVQQELREIKESCRWDEETRKQSKGPTLLLMLRSSRMRRALLVGCGLQLFQQLSGINTVMYYSASIIKMAGVNNQHTAIWLSAMTASINFVFTFIGVWLVERIGRRPLVLSSLAGVVVSLAVLAVGFQLAAFNSPPVAITQALKNSSCSSYSHCQDCIEDKGCGFCYMDIDGKVSNGSCDIVSKNDMNYASIGPCSANMTVPHLWTTDYCPTDYSWIAIFGLALYLMFFAPGMGPMPWTINAEIYPLWARSTGNSMSAATNWVANLLVSMTFLTLTETISAYGTYWLFVVVASLGFIFCLILLPETKGKKLEDVEELFAQPWWSCCGENADNIKYSVLR